MVADPLAEVWKFPQLWRSWGKGTAANYVGDQSPKWNQPYFFYFLKQNLASFANVKASTMDPKLWYLLRELRLLPQAPCMLLSTVACVVGRPCPHNSRPCTRDGLIFAITFMYCASELWNTEEYPDYSVKSFLMGIKKKAERGWGRGSVFSSPKRSFLNQFS